QQQATRNRQQRPFDWVSGPPPPSAMLLIIHFPSFLTSRLVDVHSTFFLPTVITWPSSATAMSLLIQLTTLCVCVVLGSGVLGWVVFAAAGSAVFISASHSSFVNIFPPTVPGVCADE